MRVLQAIDQPLEAGAFFDIRRNARLRLAKEGIDVVQDRCLLVEIGAIGR